LGPFGTLTEAIDALRNLLATEVKPPEPKEGDAGTGEPGEWKGEDLEAGELTQEEQEAHQKNVNTIRDLTKQFGKELDKVGKDWIPKICGGNSNADVSDKDCEEAERENREWERKRRVRKH